MSRPGVSKSDVASAVSTLRAGGKPTTTRVVRLELGRGSYATIARFLNELGTKSEARPPALPELPEAIQLRFADAVYAMWQTSSENAAKRVGDVETQCDKRIHDLSVQLTKERGLREHLEVELSSVSSDLAGCKQREHLLREAVAMHRQELRTQKALLQHAQREWNTVLKQIAPLVKLASSGLSDKLPGKARGKVNGGKSHVNHNVRQPGG